MKESHTSDFNFGAGVGLILGFVCAALLFSSPPSIDGSWVKEYQTLITGVVAVIAACLSIAAAFKQIQQSQSFRTDEIERERRSCRPLLSFVLVSISDYAQMCFEQLRKLDEHISEKRMSEFDLPLKLEMPKLPTDAFQTLQLNLKYGSEDAVAVISKLLRKLQVQHSRFVSLTVEDEFRESESVENLHVYMMNALEISTLTSRLFAYARNETNEVRAEILSGELIQAGTSYADFESQDPFLMYILKYKDSDLTQPPLSFRA